MDILKKGWLNLSGYAIHLLRLLRCFLTPNKDSALVYTYKRPTRFLPTERETALKPNTCRRGEGMPREGVGRAWIVLTAPADLSLSSRGFVSLWNRLGAGSPPKGAHLRAVLLWKGWEVWKRGELAKEPSSPLISSGLQLRSYFLRKITWLCWSSRWHCDIKANEERQASERGTDKRTGRWIFIIVMFRCKIGGCRNYQRWNIFGGILWVPYVWQFTNQEGNGA